ncbi:hypothetical protein F4604DRAFT_1933837 [Suillus subluteus]|nr:hypothetical protein F4604DRAFT_1933837 [Suillus subluteus]
MHTTLMLLTNNQVLPHGVPNLIYESPENFGALDFKVTIDQDAIDHHSINLFDVVMMTSLPPMDPLVDDNDINKDHLPLLENQRELLFGEAANDTYYMGGIHGGLGLEQDEPDASLLPAEQVVEEEELVAWFSDDEENDETYEW